jgi:hypothetical protein
MAAPRQGQVVMGQRLMTGVAVATSVIVLVTMIAAVTLLPAFLGFTGHKINSVRLPRRTSRPPQARRRPVARAPGQGNRRPSAPTPRRHAFPSARGKRRESDPSEVAERKPPAARIAYGRRTIGSPPGNIVRRHPK